MRKEAFIAGLVLAAATGIMLAFSPDFISLIVIAIMTVIVLAGFIYGCAVPMRYGYCFLLGAENVRNATLTRAKDPWVILQDADFMFRHDVLDEIFNNYREVVIAEKQRKVNLYTDISDYISEDVLETRTWKRPVTLIPETLTGLGILGTFIGLINGISNTMFTSAEVAIVGIQILLGGMETAFFTTIAGVVLSMLFNFIHEILWNILMRDMNMFVDVFHHFVIPSKEDQQHEIQTRLINDVQQIREMMSGQEEKNGEAP